jgi:hypothetical protein
MLFPRESEGILSRTSDYVYMLSGMIYNGADDEEIHKFLEQVDVESREKVLQEANKSAEASRRNSRMDARKVDQGGDW